MHCCSRLVWLLSLTLDEVLTSSPCLPCPLLQLVGVVAVSDVGSGVDVVAALYFIIVVVGIRVVEVLSLTLDAVLSSLPRFHLHLRHVHQRGCCCL